MRIRAKTIGALALAGVLAVAGSGGLAGPRATEAGVLQQQPSPTYGTGIQIVNLSATSAANVTVQAYTSTGGFPAGWPATGVSLQVEAGKSLGLFSGRDSDPVFSLIPSGSLVSFVLSSDQPIAANVNTQRVGAGTTGQGLGTDTNPFRVGTSAGVSDAQSSQTIFISQVPNGISGFNSRVYVQNTSGTTANTTWTLFDRQGAQAGTFNKAIPAYSSYEFNPSSEPGLSLGNDMFSLKVVSADASQKLAMAQNFFNSGASASTSQFHSFNGSGAGAKTLYAPRVVGRDYYNYNSGLRVQNIDAAAGDITMNFQFAALGVNCSITYTGVQPGQAVGPYLGDQSTNDGKNACLLGVSGTSATGSATIIATVNVIGNVNEDNRTLGQGATYNMFRPDEATKTAVLPQAVSYENPGLSGAVFISGVQYQNVSTGTANCTVTYSQVGRPDVTTNAVLGAGESKSEFLGGIAGLVDKNNAADKFNGSATIACDQNVVAVSNLSVRVRGNDGTSAGSGDSFITANSIGK